MVTAETRLLDGDLEESDWSGSGDGMVGDETFLDDEDYLDPSDVITVDIHCSLPSSQVSLRNPGTNLGRDRQIQDQVIARFRITFIKIGSGSDSRTQLRWLGSGGDS